MMRAVRRVSLAVGLMMTAAIMAAGSVSHTVWAQGQSQLPSFVDERRLPQNGSDASTDRQSEDASKRQQAEEEAARKAAEEAARNKAAEDERARLAAEAARKAAEEDAARNKAAEEERARQAADEAARKAAEEEAARNKAAEDERARKAAEAARKTAEEEAARKEAARKKSEQEERARQAAEAARKAAEEDAARAKAAEVERARQAAEAARKAAEEEAARKEAARHAAEAARKAAAEEAARKEAARKKADEEQRARQTSEPRSRSAADDLAQRMSSSGACKDVQLSTQAQPAGRFEIKLHSNCLAGRQIKIVYAAHEFVRTIDNAGNMSFLLDLFEGAAPLALKFDDGSTTNINVTGVSFAQISKVAVIWSTPVNLDLHAFEYLAPQNGPGHVWSKAPASLETAMTAAKEGSRGRGFLSTSDTGEDAGTHVEVYTFLHNKSQRQGVITLKIDYETRGDTPSGEHCGNGPLAEIEALVVRLRPGGTVEKELVRLGAAPCGEQLPQSKRFNSDMLSDLLARG